MVPNLKRKKEKEKKKRETKKPNKVQAVDAENGNALFPEATRDKLIKMMEKVLKIAPPLYFENSQQYCSGVPKHLSEQNEITFFN